MTKRVYLDTASTTPLDKEVEKAMRPFWFKQAGNPASLHKEGVGAQKAVEKARAEIAAFLGAHSDEIIFTSGGTEGDNLAVVGVMRAAGKNGHLIVSSIEHKAVLEPAKALDYEGYHVSYLPVDKNGQVDLKVLKELLNTETRLVSVMIANNEIGTLEPIKEIAKVIRHFRQEHNSPYPYFHTDACQAPRFLELKVESLGVDLLTLNGSKIYGPKGVGALYVRRGIKLVPLIRGGGQEMGLRSGTLNVPGIVGLAVALQKCTKLQIKESAKLSALRNYLMAELKIKVPGIIFHGGLDKRLPNNLNFSVPGLEGEQLVLELDARGFAVSSGSACSSAIETSSHVLKAIGADEMAAKGAVRISLGREITKTELKQFSLVLAANVAKLKQASSLMES